MKTYTLILVDREVSLTLSELEALWNSVDSALLKARRDRAYIMSAEERERQMQMSNPEYQFWGR